MIDNNDFINFIFIKKNSFVIVSFLKSNFLCVYKNEQILNDYDENLIKDEFKKFLDNNIFKIEKVNKQFLRDINLVIYDNNFLSVNIGFKKNILGKFIFEKEILNLLSKIKNEIELNYKELSIIHLLIDNKFVDGEDFNLKMKDNLKVCKYFSIETTFILFPLLRIFDYQNVFADYQMFVNKIISGEYVSKLAELENISESDMALKIFLGKNINEVVMFSKKAENKGFFKKFFHLFG